MNDLKKLYLWSIILPVSISFLLSIFILIFFRFLPDKLPLFYSLPWGENQLASHNQFFTIPLTLTLITLLNFAISFYLHFAQSFFKKILIAANFISATILTITFIKIVLLFI